ncbi:MAG: sigma-70 family RNA polymerase sigma factor [Clostridia bacterium]|nr:sigma-70 family RNA polymerase sigma factor [Clostridia bacterium]
MSEFNMEQIYLEYNRKVTGYLRARVNNTAVAEDLASSVFEKILRKIDSFDSTKASLNTWIFSVTRNTLIDYFRRNRPSEELDENLSDDTQVDENLLSSETLTELSVALRKLPQQLMDIVVLRYYDGKPLTEIAQMMNLSYGAVKLRHQNALALLKEYMR